MALILHFIRIVVDYVNKNDACAHVHVCLTTAVSFHQKLFTAEENKIVKK